MRTWTNDKCNDGEKRTGWIAGPLHVVPMHTSQASQPCVQLLCSPAKKCHLCEAHRPVRYVGYQPVYARDGRNWCVIVYDNLFEFAESLELHAAVEWGRKKGKGNTIWIGRADHMPVWRSTLAEKMQPADLSSWLPVLWQRPELLPDVARYFATSDNALSPPGEDSIPDAPHAAKHDGPRTKPVDRLKLTDGTPIGERVKQWKAADAAGVPRASKNGKH